MFTIPAGQRAAAIFHELQELRAKAERLPAIDPQENDSPSQLKW